MATAPTLPPNRHVPYKKGGWGAAILTTAAAIGAFLTAFYIHTQTYRHPRDLMMHQRGGEAQHGAAHGGEPAHGAAPASGGGAAGGAEAPAARH